MRLGRILLHGAERRKVMTFLQHHSRIRVMKIQFRHAIKSTSLPATEQQASRSVFFTCRYSTDLRLHIIFHSSIICSYIYQSFQRILYLRSVIFHFLRDLDVL